MGDEIFSVYLTPADYSKLAYAKLDLPASPWKLLDALDRVRLPEGDSLYLEITDYRDFEVLHSSLVCSATNLLELNDLAERLSRLNEVQRIAFEGLVRVDFQKQESITLKRLRDLTESVDCCHVVESVVSDGQLGRFYAENGFVPEVEGMSDAAFELLDFEKVGKMARMGECGVYVPSGISGLGGYVVQHSDLKSAPEITLNQPVEPAYTIHLRLTAHHDTLDEGDIHDAVISAMNELFQTQAARNAVKASISAVLAGEEQTLSLPAVELQIRNLQERQLELFQLIVSAGADCTDYDEELRQVNMTKTKLMAKKAELEKEQRGAAAFEERLAELDAELEQSCGALTDFDELTVRQLVSNIKVLDKDSLLICFKDGTEITQAMQRRQTA